ncbi:arsenosugar biosynthesis radical SAM (seleno)protein ArsS [Rubritalea tangerina]|uniref:Arsenosugar biosynthesis radical SAM (Seleno)protein ArsS n=1 Tax=Rubritalea tangerina TaxID=430798 RepID=A0ABW4Z947_9BACT
MNPFDLALSNAHHPLTRTTPEILQLNIGKLCNLTCVHCHVNAGPKRKEIMSRDTIDKILTWFEQTDIHTLDLTGGTPEMIPDFRYLVESVRNFSTPRKVMTRLNATIIEEPGYEWIPEFHAQHQISIIASMPCYAPDNVNAQRGEGVFDASISAFQKLNALGYGRTPELELNFVYNPNGAFLPPDQHELENDYKVEMKKHFDIDFHSLFCIANMPIARFASYLKRNNQLNAYHQLLREAFNPNTIEGLMCRNTINTSWLGEVFDCDFNQMLKLGLKNGDDPLFVWDINPNTFSEIPIQTASHCFGCTAGSGSSCGGSLT